jgi:hypothetical protein
LEFADGISDILVIGQEIELDRPRRGRTADCYVPMTENAFDNARVSRQPLDVLDATLVRGLAKRSKRSVTNSQTTNSGRGSIKKKKVGYATAWFWSPS